jgi:NAD(P)-dependent dehydrogenase (short-subunit alcohol dehydrogenase family)
MPYGWLRRARNVAPCAAARQGLAGLMRTMANELGEYYIRVNTIHPTNVDTPMIQNQRVWGLFTPPGEQPSVEYAISGMTARHAIPVPWLDPADISNVVLFLSSDESRYITGVALPVDAGLVIK